MALDIGDKVKVTYVQTYLAQTVLNVQHYSVITLDNVGVTLSDIIASVAEQWYDLFSSVQHNALMYRTCRMEILGKPDIAEYAYNGGLGSPGQASGLAQPSFMAYSVRQIRASKLTRHGYKRFAGVNEESVASGVLISSVQNTLAAAANDAFVINQVWSYVNQEQAALVNPIIWGDFDPLYFEGRYSDIIGCVVSPYVTTQNTRKVRASEGA